VRAFGSLPEGVHVVFVEFVVGGSDAGPAHLAHDLAPVDRVLLFADELSVEGEVGCRGRVGRTSR
jgi:hypothetical protein